MTAPLFQPPGRGFLGDCRAVAATEFAIILPVMLVLYIGGIEVTQLVGADRKTSQAVRTAADLTAQSSGCKKGVSSVPSDIANAFTAADIVAAPYPVAPLKVTLTCVEIATTGTAKVLWSYSLRGAARATGSFSPPGGLTDGNATSYWVLGEATYTYTPNFGDVLTGNITLSDQVYMRNRQ
ncbi:TadE/TadG family type IV pilus assembly protein [Blastochloris viridis]|uniref:Flp pilus assembly protein TadG n=1 Tax=Blastochloris viridis TaxID=1079 RepID=A0A0H5BGM6_BLAVI|nr:TadE/TadG family type IV pilus assembly protein [Blastochloris viridis]ALK10523.1 TadE-like protein [Blastochloris viridis]BAR99526.1 hypothetical protein BV133_1933 [Blastochloris viridis]CUU43185.1 Flp pilus assembly protein TadG [Blastochloris viridis]